ncbi:type II toxin-antitoxin system HicA family toxin [Candidatus Parcubacteria bacterium]|nr:type II toxin-antitoxin system HicA family toxin [Candidatus Parcubacteria bacterium]
MSPKLPRLTSKQLIKVLRKNGWEHARTTGSHIIMSNPETKRIVSVPQHNRVMSIGTLNRILKDAGIDRSQL